MEDKLLVEVFLFISVLAFIAKRLLRYLRYLQQEEYAPSRFIDWIKQNKAYDKRGSILAIASAIWMISPEYESVIFIIFSAAMLLLAYYEDDPRKFGKKKLVLTNRAKGIYLVSLLVSFAFQLIVYFSGSLSRPEVLIMLIQSPPFVLILSVILLSGKEKRLQRKLVDEAHDKFVKISPYTVGVTGSFGKTSVKNLLGDILSLTLGPTFWPQKGINTEMGITREIRERMNEYDKYAVVEMGAYHMGSIQKLCNLTPVNAAIVTAVHFVHLERFGGVEEVYKAKSELPQNVPQAGILVVNGDNAGARKMATEFKKDKTFIYGLETNLGQLDSVMKDIETKVDGTSFTILWNQEKYTGHTRMHGRGALSNILGCFTMACALGAKPEMVLAVVRDIEPVSNRLEVKDYKSFIQINDAYNSNPKGFLYALEVMRDLPGKRRVLLTPGMIELGNKVYEENKNIAIQAAKICDHVIIVNDVNKKSLFEGLKEGGLRDDQIKYFSTRDEALVYYQSIRQEGDIFLLENDLPDLHEFEESF